MQLQQLGFCLWAFFHEYLDLWDFRVIMVRLRKDDTEANIYKNFHHSFTLPCQIRTARCLLGPVMKCTPRWFLQAMFFASCILWVLFKPRFFTFTWNFEINQSIHDSYWNAIRMHPAVSIQTVFFALRSYSFYSDCGFSKK